MVAESESESEDDGESGGGRVFLEVISGLIEKRGFAMEILSDYRFIGTLARFLTDFPQKKKKQTNKEKASNKQRSPDLFKISQTKTRTLVQFLLFLNARKPQMHP